MGLTFLTYPILPDDPVAHKQQAKNRLNYINWLLENVNDSFVEYRLSLQSEKNALQNLLGKVENI